MCPDAIEFPESGSAHSLCFVLRCDLRYNQDMRLADPSNPAIWIATSFLLIVAATNLAWLVIRQPSRHSEYRHGPLAPAGWLILALLYLLPPIFALREGVLSPYTLGLTEIDWPTTLSDGMTLSGIIAGGLVFGWLIYRRSLPEGPLPRGVARLIPAMRAPVEAALHQWHWAFYRAVAAEWLMLAPVGVPGLGALEGLPDALQGQSLYWGAWLGLAIAGLEVALDPVSRAALRRSADAQALLRRGILAVATTGLFVMTRNLWLCLILHITVETMVTGWFPLPTQPSPAQDG